VARPAEPDRALRAWRLPEPPEEGVSAIRLRSLAQFIGQPAAESCARLTAAFFKEEGACGPRAVKAKPVRAPAGRVPGLPPRCSVQTG
jgi:hypothetical protein